MTIEKQTPGQLVGEILRLVDKYAQSYYQHRRMFGKNSSTSSLEFTELCYALEHLASRANAAEAKVDELMLEWCPDEMTPGQIENWGLHQRLVVEEKPSGDTP